jgi:hypothetical protein
MVRRRLLTIVLIAVALVGALAYLRDPPWLIDQTTGLRGWERGPDGARYRWSGGHASFFVRSDAGAIQIPISTTFDEKDSRPMMVTISIDDKIAARRVLSGPEWMMTRVLLPPPGGRRVRRVDITTSLTRDGNRGVRVGEVSAEARPQ